MKQYRTSEKMWDFFFEKNRTECCFTSGGTDYIHASWYVCKDSIRNHHAANESSGIYFPPADNNGESA